MNSMELTKPTSLTHLHILGLVHTELKSQGSSTPAVIRILDAGCGNGLLISYLHRSLAKLLPEIEFELHGFDVGDHGVQSSDFFAKTLSTLNSDAPEINWNERLTLLDQTDQWPYQDEAFDIVISNQVLEHVDEPLVFFKQAARVLKRGGFSAHLYPLKHYIKEGHLYLPFVHRIKSHDLLVGYIKLLSRLGFGKFKQHHKKSGTSLESFAEHHADYMHYFTKYMSYNDALDFGKRAGMRVSFRYTKEFYWQKLAQLAKKQPFYEYKTGSRSLSDRTWVFFLKYVSCVTLFMEKKETYTSSRSTDGTDAVNH